MFEISRLPEEAIEYFHSDFKIVADYFIRKRTNPDYRPVNPEKFRHVDEVLKLMSAVTHDNRFQETLTGEGRKPENMCEVLDRVEAKGRADGLQKGRQEGVLITLTELVKDGILSINEAAARAGMSPTEFQVKMKGLTL